MSNVHARYLDQLEAEHWLDRALEFLPTDRQIAEPNRLVERCSRGAGGDDGVPKNADRR